MSELRVRGLKSMSFMSNCNPYIYVIIGMTKQKTTVVKNRNEAEWNTERFKFPAVRARVHQLRIHLKVYDKELIRRKRLVGSVTISLAPLAVHDIDQWFALDGGEVKSAGEIHVLIRVTDM